MADFAVNVREGPPKFVLDALAARLPDLARYPTTGDEARAVAAIAAAHERPAAEILLLSGAAEGSNCFHAWVSGTPRSSSRRSPNRDRALRAAGVPITQVVLDRPWRLDTEDIARRIPDAADLVLLGNPTNPTSVLHPVATIEALRAPGRLVVVDEAFADLTLDAVAGAGTGICGVAALAGCDRVALDHQDLRSGRSACRVSTGISADHRATVGGAQAMGARHAVTGRARRMWASEGRPTATRSRRGSWRNGPTCWPVCATSASSPRSNPTGRSCSIELADGLGWGTNCGAGGSRCAAPPTRRPRTRIFALPGRSGRGDHRPPARRIAPRAGRVRRSGSVTG